MDTVSAKGLPRLDNLVQAINRQSICRLHSYRRAFGVLPKSSSSAYEDYGHLQVDVRIGNTPPDPHIEQGYVGSLVQRPAMDRPSNGPLTGDATEKETGTTPRMMAPTLILTMVFIGILLS